MLHAIYIGASLKTESNVKKRALEIKNLTVGKTLTFKVLLSNVTK